LIIHELNGDGYAKVHTAELLVPEPSAVEFKMAISKLKTHTSPGINQISREMFKAESTTIHSEIHKLINSIWNKRNTFHTRGDKIDCGNYRGICQLHTKFYLTSCSQG
jgi:hypothetical protein